MPTQIELARPLGQGGLKKLVYVRFLILQAKKFLENNTVESYYNLSVVMAANAVEMFLQVLAFCLSGKETSDRSVTKVLEDLQRRLKDLPHAELEKVIRARNAVYHRAVFHTYSTCEEIVMSTEDCLRTISSGYLKTEYDLISLTDLLKDREIAEALKLSEQHLKTGKYTDAVIEACRGFACFQTRLQTRSREQLKRLKRGLDGGSKISIRHVSMRHVIPDPNLGIKTLALEVENKVNQKIMHLAEFTDFALMLGNDYEDFKHFERIAPLYAVLLNGKFVCKRDDAEKRQYTEEDATFIFGFVLKAVLLIEPKLKPIKIRTLDRRIVGTIE